jgi:DNA-binding NarL/FixJ family response regulator
VTPRLTPKESRIVKLLCGNRSNQEIADAMSLQVGTVKGHLSRIFCKFGIDKEHFDPRVQLAVLASAPPASPFRLAIANLYRELL